MLPLAPYVLQPVLHSGQEGNQEERQPPPQAALGCFSQAGRPLAGVEPALCCRRPPHSPEPKPQSSQDARSSQEGDRVGRQSVGAGKSQSLVTYRCIFVMEFCDTGVCAALVRSALCMMGVVLLTLGAPPRLNGREDCSGECMGVRSYRRPQYAQHAAQLETRGGCRVTPHSSIMQCPAASKLMIAEWCPSGVLPLRHTVGSAAAGHVS